MDPLYPNKNEIYFFFWMRTGKLNQCKTSYRKIKDKKKKDAGPTDRTELE